MDYSKLADKLGIEPGSGVLIYVRTDPRKHIDETLAAARAAAEDGRNTVLEGPGSFDIYEVAAVVIDSDGKIIKNRFGPAGGFVAD